MDLTGFDEDKIKAHGGASQLFPYHIAHRRAREPLAFPRRDGSKSGGLVKGRSRFYLDKYRGLSIAADEVDLTPPLAAMGIHDAQAMVFQILRGLFFAPSPEG